MLAVFKCFLAHCLCSKTFGFTVKREKRELGLLAISNHSGSFELLPGDVIECDQPPGLHRCIETVGAHCLHGNDGDVCPAYVPETLDHPAEEASSTHRYHHSSRFHVRSERGRGLGNNAGVALPEQVSHVEGGFGVNSVGQERC